MKTQKAQRKLKLSRESLRVLTREGLTRVAGGFITNLGCDATIKPTARCAASDGDCQGDG